MLFFFCIGPLAAIWTPTNVAPQTLLRHKRWCAKNIDHVWHHNRAYGGWRDYNPLGLCGSLADLVWTGVDFWPSSSELVHIFVMGWCASSTTPVPHFAFWVPSPSDAITSFQQSEDAIASPSKMYADLSKIGSYSEMSHNNLICFQT